MNVPAGYKATEVGMIPEDWEVCALGDLVEFLDGKRRPVKSGDRAKMKGTFPYYGASGVVDYVNGYLFDEELILLGEDGENILSRNLPLAFRVSGKIWVNNHAHVMRPSNRIDIGYLTEFLESVDYSDFNSGTAQPKLNKQACTRIPVALPPRVEQSAIAEALSDIDEAITAVKAVIAKKRALKTATVQALLSGTRLPGFSGEWERYSFDQLFQFLRNGSSARAALSANGAIGYIHYGDIHAAARAHMDCGKGALPRIARDVVNRLPRVQNGDLLIADASEDYEGTGKSVEATNIGDDEVVAGLHTLLLRPVAKMAPGFVGYLQFIPEVRRQYVAAAQGVSVYGLSRSAVKSVEVAIPKYEEQEAISSCLIDMEIDLSHQTDKLKKLHDLKAGMMQQLLTGKIRLV